MFHLVIQLMDIFSSFLWMVDVNQCSMPSTSSKVRFDWLIIILIYLIGRKTTSLGVVVVVAVVVFLERFRLTNENPIYFVYYCLFLIGILVVHFIWLIIFIFYIHSMSHCIESSSKPNEVCRTYFNFTQLHRYFVPNTVYPSISTFSFLSSALIPLDKSIFPSDCRIS